MIQFFANKSVSTHLLRGLGGFASLIAALIVSDASLLAAAGFVVVALFAFKGCPICWTVGLFATISNRFRAPSSARSKTAHA